MKRFFCLFCCAALLLLPFPPGADAALPSDFTIRIGLSVGGNALTGANLDNHTGLGYEFGYLGENDVFIPLGSTGEKQITMVKNRNVYLSGSTYSDTPGGDLVGAFHNNLGSYAGRGEAETAAASYRAQGFPAFVSFSGGVWAVRSGSYADSGGSTRVSGSKYCISVVRTGTTDILFQFDYGETFHLCVRPLSADGAKPVTWHKGNAYYGAFEFRRLDGNDIHVINAVGIDDYIKGVIPSEMHSTWPLEALKAQAVCARTYAAGNLNRHRSGGYDLCNNTHCQMYEGTRKANALTDQAVDETAGQYFTYNGVACKTAVYHSSSGGATENSENVWNEALPYLRGIVDSYEDAVAIPEYIWQYTCTNEDLSALLTSRGIAHNGVSNFYIQKYTDTNNVYAVAFVDRNGNLITTFTKEAARTYMNFGGNKKNKSMRYNIYSGSSVLSVTGPGGSAVSAGDPASLYALGGSGELQPVAGAGGEITVISGDGLHTIPLQQPSGGSGDGVYTVIGRGSGHNVGMSQ
ncbi:MAG: SpoIID/LytB domain-containing protein, partial [Oscillospiraceae bacterium]|nr:SpoIID/LytB domain-containing protein [Oscillospiraceae bacterium]